MAKADHLSQAAQKALRLPDDQRIERISGARWIGYTRAQDVLTKLGDLLAYPHQPRGLGHMTCYTFGKRYLPTLHNLKLESKYSVIVMRYREYFASNPSMSP